MNLTPLKSPFYSDFRNYIFSEYDFTFIITKIAIKKVVKMHYVVNGYNLDWPTYATTLRPRQNSVLSKAITNNAESP